MMYKAEVTVCSEIHTKHKCHVISIQNFRMLYLVVRKVTGSLLKVKVAINCNCTEVPDADKSQPDQEGNKLGSTSETPAISTTSRR